MRVFGFTCIKPIVFFFLAATLIVSTFNFQSSVGIKIGTWYFLTCCTSLFFFTFFNELLHKSNCFRTVELHVVQLIVILFHLTALTDLILHYFNLFYYQIGLFFHILSSFAEPKGKTIKFRLLPRKTSKSGISLTFFIKRQCFQYRLQNIVVTWAKMLGQPFSIQITQFYSNLIKIAGQTS